jgi:hypothetical protein
LSFKEKAGTGFGRFWFSKAEAKRTFHVGFDAAVIVFTAIVATSLHAVLGHICGRSSSFMYLSKRSLSFMCHPLPLPPLV